MIECVRSVSISLPAPDVDATAYNFTAATAIVHINRSLTIPRPDKDSSVKVPGLGDIFVEFADSIGATAAIKGRQSLRLL
jgi:hypothetical protein